MRARGNGRMAVLKLCDQVGARGAEKGARRAPSERSAPRAVYAQPLSVHGLAAGLGSRAVSALGRRKCAFAAGEGRRDAGVAAGRGGTRIAAAPGEGSLGLRRALRSS